MELNDPLSEMELDELIGRPRVLRAKWGSTAAGDPHEATDRTERTVSVRERQEVQALLRFDELSVRRDASTGSA
jgi:hypothetical protein